MRSKGRSLTHCGRGYDRMGEAARSRHAGTNRRIPLSACLLRDFRLDFQPQLWTIDSGSRSLGVGTKGGGR